MVVHNKLGILCLFDNQQSGVRLAGVLGHGRSSQCPLRFCIRLPNQESLHYRAKRERTRAVFVLYNRWLLQYYIIYQIVQNHRLPPDTDIRDWLDERTEVFLVNAFVKFPQTFLIHRHEENICFKCGTEISPKKIKSLLNGLSSIVSSIWRYLTHVKVSTGTSSSCCNSFSCSKMCERCDTRCRNCLKSCLLDCIKCICPCCCCCIE